MNEIPDIEAKHIELYIPFDGGRHLLAEGEIRRVNSSYSLRLYYNDVEKLYFLSPNNQWEMVLFHRQNPYMFTLPSLESDTTEIDGVPTGANPNITEGG